MSQRTITRTILKSVIEGKSYVHHSGACPIGLFQVQYLRSLSIQYVSINGDNKDMEK